MKRLDQRINLSMGNTQRISAPAHQLTARACGTTVCAARSIEAVSGMIVATGMALVTPLVEGHGFSRAVRAATLPASPAEVSTELFPRPACAATLVSNDEPARAFARLSIHVLFFIRQAFLLRRNMAKISARAIADKRSGLHASAYSANRDSFARR